MEKKKYEFTEETMEVSGRLLHRIKALRDLKYASAGELGGFIEKTSNLSQKGECWVGSQALVFSEAKVLDDAYVGDSAIISDHANITGTSTVNGMARIDGFALITDNAQVTGSAHISDFAIVSGNSQISDNANVFDNAYIGGNAKILRSATVHGCVRVFDSATITDETKIHDNVIVCQNTMVLDQAILTDNTYVSGGVIGGNSIVSGDISLPKDAFVMQKTDIHLYTSPLASNDIIAFYRSTDSNVMVSYENFCGTLKEYYHYIALSKPEHSGEFLKQAEQVRKHFGISFLKGGNYGK